MVSTIPRPGNRSISTFSEEAQMSHVRGIVGSITKIDKAGWAHNKKPWINSPIGEGNVESSSLDPAPGPETPFDNSHLEQPLLGEICSFQSSVTKKRTCATR